MSKLSRKINQLFRQGAKRVAYRIVDGKLLYVRVDEWKKAKKPKPKEKKPTKKEQNKKPKVKNSSYIESRKNKPSNPKKPFIEPQVIVKKKEKTDLD